MLIIRHRNLHRKEDRKGRKNEREGNTWRKINAWRK
jgi:hypothetical protein